MYDRRMRARYEYEIDGRKLVVIDDVLTGSRLDHLASYFDLAPAQRIESDITGTDTRLWIIPIERDVAERQPYVNAIMSEVSEHFPGESFCIERVYCNAISYGDMLYAHRDQRDDANKLTALLYVNPEWKREWCGETLFFNEDGDAVHAVSPRPGRVAIFRSSIEHRAGAPSRICNRTRLTLAVKLRANA